MAAARDQGTVRVMVDCFGKRPDQLDHSDCLHSTRAQQVSAYLLGGTALAALSSPSDWGLEHLVPNGVVPQCNVRSDRVLCPDVTGAESVPPPQAAPLSRQYALQARTRTAMTNLQSVAIERGTFNSYLDVLCVTRNSVGTS